MEDATPRRQARGRARIEAILDAAAAVIAENGYDAAGMNEIARRAGISPGSLYQYFSDKHALVAALADRFRERLTSTLPDAPRTLLVRHAPLPLLVRGMLDPVLDFLLEESAFRRLFVQSVPADEIGPLLEPVDATIRERLATAVRIRAPHVDADEADRVALFAMLVVKGAVPLLADAEGARREELRAELVTLLLRYLAPLDTALRG